MRHSKENFKYAGSLEEVIMISRKMTGKMLNLDQRKADNRKQMQRRRDENVK